MPVSRLIKQGEDEDGPTKKSRDEYRKAKELEEARYYNAFFGGERVTGLIRLDLYPTG